MIFDILIKDGTIIDGSGQPRFRGDVGIQDGRIQDIGRPALEGAKAAKTITAADKFVAPGFIDITHHADHNWSLFQNPGQDYLLTQGVSTILVGNCGTSYAPLPSREAIESLRKWLPSAGININWLTMREFLAELERHELGVNVATLIGHGTIRRGILKNAPRPLTPDELSELIGLMRQGMRDGAFGLSTGLIYSHEASATLEELTALARAVAEADGIYKTHLRHEGTNLAPAVNEAVELRREANVRVIISHFKAIGKRSWPTFPKTLQMIERANEDGANFHFDISPYQRTGSFLYLLLPPWAREGGFGAMLERIQNPETRTRIIAALKGETIVPDRYIVASSAIPGANGKTVLEMAEHANQTPEEAILDLLSASRGKVTIFGKTLSFNNLLAGIAHPLGVIASDGSGVSTELIQSGKLVHPRSTGAFPHFLHRFVKEREVMTWEEGIRKITSLPAEVAGFRERGRIQPQYRADIAVFNPEAIRDRSSYHNPYVHATGIEAVVINGKLAIESGQPTGVAAGQVLRRS